jgi:SAM-dependent methyltransferase
LDSSASKVLWNSRPVGSQRSTAEPGTPTYFDDLRAYRYGYETPFIPRLIRSLEPQGKRVLELGVGNGIDAAEFVRLGARYTGVDVTKRHLELTAANLARKGLAPTELRLGEIVDMRFDEPFDVVYSFGVLHHIPHWDLCLQKLASICKPDGRAMVALYARASAFNAYLLATWLLKDKLRHGLDAWRSHLCEASPLDEPVTVRICGKSELTLLLRRTGWNVQGYRRYGFVSGYLPIVGRHLDPDSRVLDGLARFFGWYHVFTCAPADGRRSH